MRRSHLFAPLVGAVLVAAGLAGPMLQSAAATEPPTVLEVHSNIPGGVDGFAPGARALAVTYTQISVRAGDQVTFSATGSVRGGQLGSFRDFGPDGAPAGSQDFSGPVSGGAFPAIDGTPANIYSLIGTVIDGSGTELTSASTWFGIGSERTITMTHTGTLAFLVHDALYRADWTRVYDDNAGSFQVSVTVGNNEAPVAALSANPAASEWGEPTVFNTAGTTDPDGQIASWRLTFGDGNEVSGPGAPPREVVHTYRDPGTPQATLTVTDDGRGQPSRALTSSAQALVTSTTKKTSMTDTGSSALTIGRSRFFASTILRASLRTTRAGQPVAGRLVTFRLANGVTACVATTDSDGTAGCSTVVPLALAFGYSASFDGDVRYGASSLQVTPIVVAFTR